MLVGAKNKVVQSNTTGALSSSKLRSEVIYLQLFLLGAHPRTDLMNNRSDMELNHWEELQRRLNEARTALETSQRGELEVSHVMRIVATFGPRLDTIAFRRGELKQYPLESIKGWQRRAWNAILCAEKVLPIWLKAEVMPSNVEKVLREAHQVVRSGIPPTQYNLLELEPSSDDVGFIGCADGAYQVAGLAIGTAIWDGPNNLDIQFTYQDPDEIGYDPMDVPNVVYAVRVYAGDYDAGHDEVEIGEYVVWRGSNEARREFWLWWLNEAVPASWDLQDV